MNFKLLIHHISFFTVGALNNLFEAFELDVRKITQKKILLVKAIEMSLKVAILLLFAIFALCEAQTAIFAIHKSQVSGNTPGKTYKFVPGLCQVKS